MSCEQVRFKPKSHNVGKKKEREGGNWKGRKGRGEEREKREEEKVTIMRNFHVLKRTQFSDSYYWLSVFTVKT